VTNSLIHETTVAITPTVNVNSLLKRASLQLCAVTCITLNAHGKPLKQIFIVNLVYSIFFFMSLVLFIVVTVNSQ